MATATQSGPSTAAPRACVRLCESHEASRQRASITGRSLVTMALVDFRFTDEQRLWHDTLHDFMDKEVGRDYTASTTRAASSPTRCSARSLEQGWLGILVPEQYGGLAADPVMFAIFCEAIAKFSLDTAACVMTSMFTATNISHNGTTEQKARYLPPFLAGTRSSGSPSPSPEAGSDAASVKTQARCSTTATGC